MGNAREVNPSQAVLIACLALENHGEEDSIVAIVGNEPVYSGQVNNYISRFRSIAGLSDCSAWQAWLERSGLDIQMVRSDTITFLVDYLLIQKAARERGVSVEQCDVQRHVDMVMASPDVAVEAWTRLMRLGITEEQLEKGIRANLLRAALVDDISNEFTRRGHYRYGEAPLALESKAEEVFIRSYETFDRWFEGYRRKANVEILRSD